MNDFAIKHKKPTQEEIELWYKYQQELANIKSKEWDLRNKIYQGLFEKPVEGTNNYVLPDGWVLKATRTVNRSIDEPAMEAMRKGLAKAGIVLDDLIERKPTLKISAYRKLTDEQRRMVDCFLVIKDGAPSMKIQLPKKALKTPPVNA